MRDIDEQIKFYRSADRLDKNVLSYRTDSPCFSVVGGFGFASENCERCECDSVALVRCERHFRAFRFSGDRQKSVLEMMKRGLIYSGRRRQLLKRGHIRPRQRKMQVI